MRKIPEDLTGQIFNNLTVIEYIGNYKHKCVCICGKSVVSSTSHIKTGHIKSCGCVSYNIKHGKSKTKEYGHWTHIKERCYNKDSPVYEYYGAKGIKMSEDWKNSFEIFIKEVGERPSIKHSLDRINNEGNYELGNVRWVTHKEQCNNRSNNILIIYKKETLNLKEWCEKLNLKYLKIWLRIFRYNWSIEKAFETP